MLIGRTDAEASILWPPDAKGESLEKTLILGKNEGKRRRGWQGLRWLDSITDSVDVNLSKLQEVVEERRGCHAAVPSHRVRNDLATEKQQLECNADFEASKESERMC